MIIVLKAFLLVFQESLAVNLSVQEDENYISPVNLTFLQDNSTDTCTTFQADIRSNTPQFTTFRIPVYEDPDYVNITLIGQNLSCGYNLYVIPITALQTKDWTGIWTICPLITRLIKQNLERCTFHCKCLGGCAEIQVSKRPRNARESSWTLCHFYFAYPPPGLLLDAGCDNFAVKQTGIYQVQMTSNGNVHNVYCDTETEGGGWMIMLRRVDGSENFARDWEDYKVGFGSLTGEFWAGNELVHKLTTAGQPYSLRVELESYEGEYIFAVYNTFWLGPESDNYRLHVSGYLSESTAGDSIGYHNNLMFTTASCDNDDDISGNCAIRYGAPWWFGKCHTAFLTGKYGSNFPYAEGITWKSAWGYYKFARYATMMIRPNV